MNPQETSRLAQAAKARAIQWRREAVEGFWGAVFAAMRRAFAFRRSPKGA
jgi:hypothetical protein